MKIQKGAVAKSCMTNSLLIYVWLNILRISSYIRKSFLTYDFATDFLIYEENLNFFFISAVGITLG